MRPLFLAALLVFLVSIATAGDRTLSLAQRVSFEKVSLAEQYQKQLQQCREEKRKAVRERCQAKRKAEFDEQLAALNNSPRRYFQDKERQIQDEQTVRQAGTGD